jgi:hypothetical protein
MPVMRFRGKGACYGHSVQLSVAHATAVSPWHTRSASAASGQAGPASARSGQPTAAKSPCQAAFHASSSLSRAPAGPGIGPNFAQMRRHQARRCPLRYRQRRLGNAGVIQIGRTRSFFPRCAHLCASGNHARTCTYAGPEFAATPFSPSWLVMAACGSATTEPSARLPVPHATSH